MTPDQQHMFDILKDRPSQYYVGASDSERKIFREWILGLLREREVRVEFTKSTGETRVMTCTLQESVLPPAVNKDTNKKPNPDVCVVWDVGQGAWRSFRWDRTQRIEFTIG